MSCPLLLDLASYHPDTEDLLQNKDAREYWLQCFEDATEKVTLVDLGFVTELCVHGTQCIMIEVMQTIVLLYTLKYLIINVSSRLKR